MSADGVYELDGQLDIFFLMSTVVVRKNDSVPVLNKTILLQFSFE